MFLYYSRLIEKEHRLTYARKKVLDALIMINEHQTVDDIHKKCHDIGIATVYRTLDLFESLAITETVHIDQVKYYKINQPHHKFHIHYICDTCGKLFEFQDDSFGDEQRVLVSSFEKKFHHSVHQITMTGVCSMCITK